MDNFNNLPPEIILDILTRLSAESVLDCKLVSKPWRDLIHHPSFSKMHVNRLNHHVESGKLGFLALAAENSQLHYFEYIENNETTHVGKTREINRTPPSAFHTFVGSINGLICLSGHKDSFCIYNPMTKEYVSLPEPKINAEQYTFRWIGFGYLVSTNEYKAVLMYKKQDKYVEVMVYTLGGGNGWRNIGKFDLQFNLVFSGHGVFANGALHWRNNEGGIILVFDLADERFREYLAPPTLPEGSSLEIGVLGGFLFAARRYYYSLNTDQSCSDIWLYVKKNDDSGMLKKDEHLSWDWSKVITLYDIPLAFTNSGGVLASSSRYLDIYYPKAVSYEKLVDFEEQFHQMFTYERLVDFEEEFHQVFPHTNTLVSLKQLGEEGTKTMKSVNTKKRKRRSSSEPAVVQIPMFWNTLNAI